LIALSDLPDLDKTALLLDVDGTLIDIAPTPDEVQVPSSLKQTLARLQEKTGGALALVSGRIVSNLDQLFAPLKLSSVGCHGAEIRLFTGGRPVQHGALPLADEIRHRLSSLASSPGVLFEDKLYSVAIHYRLAPDKKQAIEDRIAELLADWPADAVNIMHGKAVIEIKRPGFDKGVGIRELMRHAPFAGRQPIFIGDDVTDEYGFAAMPEFGGVSISVGRTIEGVLKRFDAPTDVRRWLQEICKRAEASETGQLDGMRG
jgi:trehalose 6-phosphate phosphatase